jgi:hypothetical protein
MNWKETDLRNAITKLIKIIKPEGVLDIIFKLDHFHDDRWHMNVNFILPDDSEYLNLKKIPDRLGWTNEIKNNIYNFLGVRVIINSSSFTSKSYQDKMYENKEIKQVEALAKLNNLIL